MEQFRRWRHQRRKPKVADKYKILAEADFDMFAYWSSPEHVWPGKQKLHIYPEGRPESELGQGQGEGAPGVASDDDDGRSGSGDDDEDDDLVAQAVAAEDDDDDDDDGGSGGGGSGSSGGGGGRCGRLRGR